MKRILIKTWQYDSFSSTWRRYLDIITSKWPYAKFLVKEAKEQGFKVKVVIHLNKG